MREGDYCYYYNPLTKCFYLWLYDIEKRPYFYLSLPGRATIYLSVKIRGGEGLLIEKYIENPLFPWEECHNPSSTETLQLSAEKATLYLNELKCRGRISRKY